MKLKMTEDGKNAVLQDGKPVYIYDDGREAAFDAPATVVKISTLNREAQTHREAKEAAEGKLRAFEGITDPEAARTALQTVANLTDKKLVDAGQVAEIKAAAIAAVEEKYKPVVAERDTLQQQLQSEMIGGAFSRSKFIEQKLAIPADLVQARFAQAFEIKDGKVLAKDHGGNPIYSRARPGEPADFDEALETLVDAYPQKDRILKGTGGGGSGARPSPGTPGAKTITRQDFNALDPSAQAARHKDGFAVVD